MLYVVPPYLDLKSNMDRFIEKSYLQYNCLKFYLKSNMDRFIVPFIYKSIQKITI